MEPKQIQTKSERNANQIKIQLRSQMSSLMRNADAKNHCIFNTFPSSDQTLMLSWSEKQTQANHIQRFLSKSNENLLNCIEFNSNPNQRNITWVKSKPQSNSNQCENKSNWLETESKTKPEQIDSDPNQIEFTSKPNQKQNHME